MTEPVVSPAVEPSDDAVSRARELAAKLSGGVAGTKRKASASDTEAADGSDAEPPSSRRKVEEAPEDAEGGGAAAAALEAKRAALRALADGGGDVIAADVSAVNPASVGSTELVTIVFSVPTAVAGSVIGRGGENVQQIQQRTGARVSVQSAGDAAGASERNITVTGSAAATAEAKRLIIILAEERARSAPGSGALSVPGMGMGSVGSLGAGGMGGPGGLGGGQFHGVFECPNEKVGGIIGRGGSNIKTIQSKTSTHISVPKEASGPLRPIAITGPSQAAVDAAMQEIQNIVNGGGDPVPAGGMGGMGGGYGGMGGMGGGYGGGMGGGMGGSVPGGGGVSPAAVWP